MQSTFTDQLNEEIEELQLQINQLRKEKKKVKEDLPEPIGEVDSFKNALKD
jgi:chaperonin cofactor prefoldin